MIEFLLRFFDAAVICIFCIIFIVLGYRPPWWFRPQTDCNKGVRLIPGPPSLPLIGTTWTFFWGKYPIHQLHEHFKDIRNKYGNIVKEEYWGNIPVISIFDKRDIIKVVRSGGKYPLRPPVEAIMMYRRSRRDRYASSGLVNEQGEMWYHLRANLTPVFSSPKTVSAFLPEVHAIVDDWCNLLKQSRDSSFRVSLTDLADRLGLELTCALVLGRRMGFLLPGAETQTGKALAAAVRQHFLATRDTYFGIPFWKLFPTPAYKRLCKSEDTIYNLALELVNSANESTKESIVFQSILKADIDDKEKTAAIVDFMSAGIHTLKNSLLFLLHLVGQKPEVQKKIVADDAGGYSKACLTESFRLLPTANPLARILDEEMEVAGHRLQPGTPILCHFGLACRDEDNFKQAQEFIPERWLEDGTNNAMLLVPFGTGRRICPGKRLMEHVLPVILEETVKNFEVFADEELEVRYEFMLAPKEDISMVFKDRV